MTVRTQNTIFPWWNMAKDPYLYEPGGTCFNLGKLAYVPMVIITSLAMQSIWITFQFRSASEFNLVVLFSVSFSAGGWTL